MAACFRVSRTQWLDACPATTILSKEKMSLSKLIDVLEMRGVVWYSTSGVKIP